MDLSRLEKLVRLAGSDNDHEALLALRNAQKLAKGDLWGALHGGSHHQGSSSDGRRIQALEKQLEERRARITSLSEELSELRNKLRAARSGSQDLQPFFEHEGFAEIYYEVHLKHWITDNRFRPSTNKENWISVVELKRMFEKTLDRPLEVSLKRFSLAFSRCMSPKGGKSLAVKGGPKQDLMGFMVRVINE